MKQFKERNQVEWKDIGQTFKDIILNPEGKFLSVSQISRITDFSREYINAILVKANLFGLYQMPNPSANHNGLMSIYPAEKVLPLFTHPTPNSPGSDGLVEGKEYCIPELEKFCNANENQIYAFITRAKIAYSDKKKVFGGKKRMLRTVSYENAKLICNHFSSKTKQEEPNSFKNDPDYAEFLEFKKWKKEKEERENFDLKPEWVNN